ncbi:BRISC complex subunit FAM175B [Frankliniella fusca]|uniref:BRISC complex subunit FAM175B n=1 Tax=Frankliniella fusca TaxID=407009 RepID=A0AAE1HCV0_9NEOP|nr:BRISC complex subunit FAM175B [Frankliniella fusca]
MQSSVYVTASGPALSLLLYENTKIPGYQMGFLLGAVVNQVIDTISDSQIRVEKTEISINISSILPFSSSSGVINGAGKIDKEKLKTIVSSEKSQQLRSGSQNHDIVGWYSFKRNSVFQMSMREQVVHLQLAEMAKDFIPGGSPDLFVLCLLSNTLTSQATHVFKHSFMRYLREKNTFDLIPLQIHNLGMAQASLYKNTACAPGRAALLQELFERISAHTPGKDHMLQVQSELQVLLNRRIQQLSEAENTRISLESEVENLRLKLERMKAKQVKRRSIPGVQNNGTEIPTTGYEQSAVVNRNNHKRSFTKNADGDGSQDCSTNNKIENHISNDRTSPVLGVTQRRRNSRPETPETKRSGTS